MEEYKEKETIVMSVKDIIAITGVTRDTVYRWIREGRLTPLPKNPYKKRDELRFDPDDVEKLKNG